MNAVWNELEKENKEFFEPYMKLKSRTITKEEMMRSNEETTHVINNLISTLDSSQNPHQDDK